MDNQTFKSVLEVLAFLNDEMGRKVNKSKLYKDRALGRLRVEPDGSYSLKSVKQYALSLPLLSGVDVKMAGQAETIALRKALADAEKAEESARLMAFKREILEGKHIPRSQFELLLAGRAVMLEEGLRGMVERDCAELIEAAGGVPQNARAFCDLFVDKLELLLTEYTRLDEIEVEFEADSTDFVEEDDADAAE